jgi:hypothetical protein
MDDASVVTIDFVGNAIDLDAIAGALDGRDNVKSSTEDGKPILEMTKPFQLALDAGSVNLHAVRLWAHAKDPGRINLAAVT